MNVVCQKLTLTIWYLTLAFILTVEPNPKRSLRTIKRKMKISICTVVAAVKYRIFSNLIRTQFLATS
jgi:hypothetical protein